MRPARDATSSRPQWPWSHFGLLLTALLACRAAAGTRDSGADAIPPLPPEQTQAIAAIEGRAGRVERDKERPGAPVIRVMLGDPRTSDSDLVPLIRLAAVQLLVIALVPSPTADWRTSNGWPICELSICLGTA